MVRWMTSKRPGCGSFATTSSGPDALVPAAREALGGVPSGCRRGQPASTQCHMLLQINTLGHVSRITNWPVTRERGSRPKCMCATAASQPQQAAVPSVSEFDAGRWRKDELLAFAKSLQIPTKGNKAELVARIRLTLVRRSMSPTPEVHIGTSAAASVPPAASAQRTSAAARDFFRADSSGPRATALAAWFAGRTATRR